MNRFVIPGFRGGPPGFPQRLPDVLQDEFRPQAARQAIHHAVTDIIDTTTIADVVAGRPANRVLARRSTNPA